MDNEAAKILADAILKAGRMIGDGLNAVSFEIGTLNESDEYSGSIKDALVKIASSIVYAADHIGTSCDGMGAIEAVGKELHDHLGRLADIADSISSLGDSVERAAGWLQSPADPGNDDIPFEDDDA